jgi:hypothetical protein
MSYPGFIWLRMETGTALANMAINFKVPLKEWDFLTGRATISTSKGPLLHGVS